MLKSERTKELRARSRAIETALKMQDHTPDQATKDALSVAISALQMEMADLEKRLSPTEIDEEIRWRFKSCIGSGCRPALRKGEWFVLTRHADAELPGVVDNILREFPPFAVRYLGRRSRETGSELRFSVDRLADWRS